MTQYLYDTDSPARAERYILEKSISVGAAVLDLVESADSWHARQAPRRIKPFHNIGNQTMWECEILREVVQLKVCRAYVEMFVRMQNISVYYCSSTKSEDVNDLLYNVHFILENWYIRVIYICSDFRIFHAM